MSKQRYPEEFKTEAAKQMSPDQRQAQGSQADELRRLKAELKRVTEERDILKKAAAYFAKQSG